MSDNKLESVIAKVKLLLSLAGGSNNENEVKAATAAADRLMQEYRISQAQVEAADVGQQEPMVAKVVSEGGRRTAWRETLLHALTKHYGCAWYLYSHRVCGKHSKGRQSYTIVGRQGDTEIVYYMFSYLESETERLCRWHAGGKGVKYAAAWLMGCAEGIASQFYDMAVAARAQTEVSHSSALAILDKRSAEADEHMCSHLNVKGKASHIGGAQDYSARSDGRTVGKTVQIRQGLGGSATSTAKLGA